MKMRKNAALAAAGIASIGASCSLPERDQPIAGMVFMESTEEARIVLPEVTASMAETLRHKNDAYFMSYAVVLVAHCTEGYISDEGDVIVAERDKQTVLSAYEYDTESFISGMTDALELVDAGLLRCEDDWYTT